MRPLLLILFGIGTLLLRAGFAMQASGSVRAKNAASTALRILVDTAGSALAFWAVGAGLLFQTKNKWIGFDPGFLFREPPDSASREFFHMTLCIMGSAVVTGALAERARFFVGVICSAILGGLVFPILGHCVWFGGLRDLNFIDIGGAGVIHVSAAVFALIGIGFVRARADKFVPVFDADSATPVPVESVSIPGHSIPMMLVGTLLLLAGWFPYLMGCLIAHPTGAGNLDDILLGISVSNILLAGCGGIFGGLILSQLKYQKPDLFFAAAGLLGGLVAISSGFSAVTSLGAISIGLVAGVIIPMLAIVMETRGRIDDPIGLIAIHGAGGIWGTLATAMFVPTAVFLDHFKLLAVQCGGLAIVITVTGLVATITFTMLQIFSPLRVNEADENRGLDYSDHGTNAYPEF